VKGRSHTITPKQRGCALATINLQLPQSDGSPTLSLMPGYQCRTRAFVESGLFGNRESRP